MSFDPIEESLPVCHECGQETEEAVYVGGKTYCEDHPPLRQRDFTRSPTSRCMACKALAPTYRSECRHCFEDRTGVEVLP